MRLAGIDIGTNTIRLLIAELGADRRIRETYSDRRITRLGESLIRTGNLSEAAMNRTLEVLRRYGDLCRKHEVQSVISVATSAVRESSNGHLFVKKIQEELGLRVRVLSGTEEASLTLSGVVSDLSSAVDQERSILMMDIGGGSTEFVSYSPQVEGGRSRRSDQANVRYRISTDLGVVLMTERYIHSDPISPEDLEALSQAVWARLREVPPPVGNGQPVMVGTAGTVTTLAAIDLGLTEYDPQRVHHSILKKETVDEWLKRFLTMTVSQRLSIPGLESGREDIIVSGTLIVQKAMEWFGFHEMVVSDYGLREGAVLALFDEMTPSCQ
ncbi:MAG: Ppx/GppA family phosphatase [Nitrospirae bacterium]|nr:Ppx/GppA family phosphatase [Nitrospirota bacterium]